MESEYRATRERMNYAGLCRIFMELLRDVLWRIVTKEIGITNLRGELTAYLRRQRQRDHVYHQFERLCGLPGGIQRTDCDISVLYSILRNVKSELSMPNQGWSEMPTETDHLVLDDVVRIRIRRNDFVGHPTNASISDENFQIELEKIMEIVKRLDKYLGTDFVSGLTQIKNDCMASHKPPRDYEQCVEETKKQKKRLSEMSERVHRLESEVKGTEKRISILEQICLRHPHMAFLESGRSAKDESIFKEYLLKKYQQDLATIKLSKWCDAVNVLDISVPLVIREDLERWLSMNTLERKPSLSEGERTDMKSYKDVFVKDKEKQNEIYLVGEAGVGKSTFCLQVINCWCKLQKSQLAPDNDYERILSEFDFVFFVMCRHAKRKESVLSIILNQLCPTRFHDFVKGKFMSHPEKCLVLLDGLDEWTNRASDEENITNTNGLPDTKDIDGSFVLTTSRPWRIETLERRLTSSCRVLEIVGLDSDGVIRLSKNILKALGEVNPQAALRKFQLQIDQQNLTEIVKMPLMLTIILISWHGGKQTLEKSMCLNYAGLLESVICHSVQKQNLESKHPLNTYRKAYYNHSLPKCFAEKQLCIKYSYLIEKLASLAFTALFNDSKENCLVFNKKKLHFQLGEDVLEMCLALGILSETKSHSESIVCKVHISFIHKSIQEFLAAVHMFGNNFRQCFSIFRQRVNTLLDIHNSKLVIQFLCGMSPLNGEDVVSYVTELAGQSQMFHCYRLCSHWCVFESGDLDIDHHGSFRNVELIQKLLAQCIAELSYAQDNSTFAQHGSMLDLMKSALLHYTTRMFKQKSRYCIPDIIINNSSPPNVMEQLYNQSSRTKSLVFDERLETPMRTIESLKQMFQLEKLCVGSCAEKASKYMQRICSALQGHIHLKAFGFHSTSEVTLPRDVYEDLFSKLTSVHSVHLRNLDFSRDCSIVFPQQIQSLSLSEVLLSDQVIFPPHCSSLSLWDMNISEKIVCSLPTNLTSLYMYTVHLNEPAMEAFCKFLKQTSSLVTLTLYSRECDYSIPIPIDLSAHISLQIVRLGSLEMSAGLILTNLSQLKLVDIRDAFMPVTMWKLFIQQLSRTNFHQLKVHLCDVDIDEETGNEIVLDICAHFIITKKYVGKSCSIIHFHTKTKT